MKTKIRLDVLSVERGLFNTRQEAQAAIMNGAVLVDGKKVTKPGFNVPENAQLATLIEPGHQFVSRGGVKLEKALQEFQIVVRERECVDIGASTGGFTDCLLRYGASKVYAIDVGYGQLAWSLRNDSRVIVHERTNARALTPELLYGASPPTATLAVADVSFISLSKIFPALVSVIKLSEADVVCLIKPQFEAGKQQVGRGGVVRRPEVQAEAIKTAVDAAVQHGLFAHALTYSPLKGPAGNIEFLAHLRTTEIERPIDILAVVNAAHEMLK